MTFKQTIYVIVFLVLIFFPLVGHPHEFKAINVILSSDTQTYRQVEASLKVRLKQLQVSDSLLQVYSLTQWPDQLASDEQDVLYVAVGTRATQKVFSQRPKGQVVSVMITREAYSLLDQQYATQSTRFSAVYINQPIERVINLVHELFPLTEKIGLFLGENSQATIANEKLPQNKVESVVVSSDSNVSDLIESLLERSDVVVTLPDPNAMNPSNAKWLLYMAYQRRVPIIGFSQAMAKAGAVASIFTTPTQIGVQTAEWIKGCLTFKVTSPIKADPAYFKVSINQWVARSLGLDFPSESLVEQSLLNARQPSP